jgi:hypothetical protein
VAGRSTRSLDVTMTEREQSETGPSDRAVALSRVWLVITGSLFLVFGIGIAVTGDGVDRLWAVAMAAAGVAQFIAARYASSKVAFIFAWLGP